MSAKILKLALQFTLIDQTTSTGHKIMKDCRLTHLCEMPGLGVGDLHEWAGFRPPSLHVNTDPIQQIYVVSTQSQ